jgi:RNA polymerase sigma-70 factor, ECF subfamily
MLSLVQGAPLKPVRSPATQTPGRDEALLGQVARGDRGAFETLYYAYHPRLARFLGRVTWRADLVDEVINDTLWIVWRKAGEFRGASTPSTWIFGIAYRCALKALRRRGMSDAPLADAEAVAELPLEEQERRDWILSGMRHLPLEQRTTLQLAYYLGHSLEEIAQIMDCPVSTVKARMFHARVKLRNVLPKLGGLPDTPRRTDAGST